MIPALFAMAAAASFLLAAHPFTTYPASLWVLARGTARKPLSGPIPQTIAVCVCAYNEASVIGDRVRNLLAMRALHRDLEILVYVDAATDDTARILYAFGDAIKVVVATERHGKTHGMNRLVAMTKAEIIVFSDANVMFAKDAVAKLVAPFADPAIGCTCGHLRYVDPVSATSTAQAGSLYWRLEEWIKSLESKTGSVMGADGSIFAIRRALYSTPPAHLIDDMYVSLSILCGGNGIVRVADAIATELSVSRPAEEFRRKMRIACQAFNVNRALWPRLIRLRALDRYKYVSHKLLRWTTIYLLALCCVFSLAAISIGLGVEAGGGALLVGTLAIAALALARKGPLGTLREALLAFLATGLGIARSVRGETFQTWNPPESARALMQAQAPI